MNTDVVGIANKITAKLNRLEFNHFFVTCTQILTDK